MGDGREVFGEAAVAIAVDMMAIMAVQQRSALMSCRRK